MNIPVRYPMLIGTAAVAAVFSLVVGLLMTLDFVGRGKFELFDTPEYLVLKQQLKDQPGDEQVQQTIRELDLHLRDSYFRNRRFLAHGMYLLLGGVVLTLIATRWALSLRRQLYHPPPIDPELDYESATQRYGKWAAVGVIVMVVGVLCGIALRTEQILPAPGDEVASALPATAVAPPPRDNAREQPTAPAEPDRQSEPSVPRPGPIEPRPDSPPPPGAALPAYEVYLQQWPRFRGPLGAGVSQYSDPQAQTPLPR